MNETHTVWGILLPHECVESFIDQGITVAHSAGLDKSSAPFPIEVTISNYIELKKSKLDTYNYFFNELKFINNYGNNKKIKVPENMEVWHAFKWCENLPDYRPTILQSRLKLVTLCSSGMNWDGLSNVRILTVDLIKNKIHAQWWENEWIDKFEKTIPAEFDPEDWMRDNIKVYLNSLGEELVAYSYYYKLGVVIHLRWRENRWDLISINLESLDSYINKVGFMKEAIVECKGHE